MEETTKFGINKEVQCSFPLLSNYCSPETQALTTPNTSYFTMTLELLRSYVEVRYMKP